MLMPALNNITSGKISAKKLNIKSLMIGGKNYLRKLVKKDYFHPKWKSLIFFFYEILIFWQYCDNDLLHGS